MLVLFLAVKFGSMGIMKASLCSPWLVGWQWGGTAVEMCAYSFAGSQGRWKSHCNFQCHHSWRNKLLLFWSLLFHLDSSHLVQTCLCCSWGSVQAFPTVSVGLDSWSPIKEWKKKVVLEWITRDHLILWWRIKKVICVLWIYHVVKCVWEHMFQVAV